MRRRALLGLSLVAALAGAAGLAARTLTPPGIVVLDWQMDHPDFGGWSGIEVSGDGSRFWAVGDRGVILRGRLLREDGRLVEVRSGRPRQIRGEVTPRNLLHATDAEGLALGPDGEIAISYERFARVWRHAGWRAPATRLHQSEEFPGMENNGSLEALAALPDGRLLTLPELPASRDSYPVFVNDRVRWQQAFSLERDGFWRAVGADLGPDGALYLLERQFVGFGFASRIRRFDIAPMQGRIPGDTLYRSLPGQHGNLEGIATWRDPDGHIRAVLVTDDNFMPFQRSEIVELILH